MKIYAQINDNKICIGISQLSGEVDAENMIEIPSFDESYMWKMYTDGIWSDEKFSPEVSVEPREPSNSEIAHMISDLVADLTIKGVI